MIEINGITWNHSRGYEPLIAASDMFHRNFPNVSIKWKKRTLEEFGDFPVNILAENFDLLMIDHPFSGEAKENNIFVPLDEYISESEMESKRVQSVGPSFDSYVYEDKLMALSCDAAAQVSAYVSTKVQKHDIPTTWEDLEYFAAHHNIAVPLCAIDIWCVFLTLSAQLSMCNFFSEEGIDPAICTQAIDMIYKLIDISDPASMKFNPIQILDLMKHEEKILYSPFLFGYTNYSRGGEKANIVFSNVFSVAEYPIALLGGVGIAVSAQSKYREESIAFAKFVTDCTFQEKEYFFYDGQPACLSAWCSKQNNEACNYFFENTLQTLQHAYVRPRLPKFNKFQEYISKYIHVSIQEHMSAKNIVNTINNTYHTILKKE